MPKLATTTGVPVRYCGHAGYFQADLTMVGSAVVVRASGPVTPANIIRTDLEQAKLWITDFPEAGFWRPDLGVFVVPIDQLKAIR